MKPVTGVVPNQDGTFSPYCRICPGRYRSQLSPDERVGGKLPKREAITLVKKHRNSDLHLKSLRAAADTSPSREEMLLHQVLGPSKKNPLPEPCPRCDAHHSRWLACDTAARIRAEGPRPEGPPVP